MFTEPSDAILVPASREQWIQSVRNTAPQWGLPLTEAQHVEKETILEKTELCNNGKFRGWVLVPQGVPHTLDFFCSCETFERRVLVAADGAPCTTHISYSVASVWCPPKFRKRGYATRMMTLLHSKIAQSSWLKANQLPDSNSASNTALLSVLYSDVGDFYSRATPPGWHIKDRETTQWIVRASDLPPSFPNRVTPLSEHHLLLLATGDAAELRRELQSRSRKGKIYFAILPTGHDATWLVTRSLIFSDYLRDRRTLGGGTRARPEVWGAQVSEEAWATWFVDFANDILYFSRIRCTEVEDFKLILAAARSVAYGQGVAKIKAWCLPAHLGEATGGKTAPREDSLPALAWYGRSPFGGIPVDTDTSQV